MVILLCSAISLRRDGLRAQLSDQHSFWVDYDWAYADAPVNQFYYLKHFERWLSELCAKIDSEYGDFSVQHSTVYAPMQRSLDLEILTSQLIHWFGYVANQLSAWANVDPLETDALGGLVWKESIDRIQTLVMGLPYPHLEYHTFAKCGSTSQFA